MAVTLTPTPFQTVLDATGVAVNGALIYTYVGGTTTALATYTTSVGDVANANPIVADSAGRYVAYLAAGANYKFVFKTSAGATIRTQDNVLAVPGSAVNLDIQGTVGEAVTAGQVVYLSSGAEAVPLTPGLWYLADADAAVTSTTCQSIGVAVSAIAINSSGTIRLAGEAPTASAVVVGTTYYVSTTAGAITSTAPTLARQVGVSITTSTIVLAATTAIAASIPNPITQDLLFTDNTYDIGKSGATRPRDLFQSRNATIGGTLAVTGNTTLTGTLASGALTVTGAATVSSTLGVTGATTLSSTLASGALTVTGAATVSSTLGVTGAVTLASNSASSVTIGGGATASTLRLIEPSGSGTNYTAFQAQAQAANVTYTLPAADGTSSQYLSTDGLGSLSWATFTPAILTKTANYTVQTSDGPVVFVLCNTTSAGFNITLPTAVGNTQRITILKTVSTNAGPTILTTSSQTVNNAASGVIALYVANDCVTVVSDGSNWRIVSENVSISASAYRSTVQSIPTATTTKVQLNSESWDYGSLFDTSVNYRFTAPRAGRYSIFAISGYSNASGIAATHIFKNGAVIAFASCAAGTPSLLQPSITTQAELAKDDYLELYSHHTTGSSQNLRTGPENTSMSVCYLGNS